MSHDIWWVFVQFTARLLENSSVRVKISCWCPPCYCWNAELCFIVFVVKFIVYVYACRGLGSKAVNKISIYLSHPRDIGWPGQLFNTLRPRRNGHHFADDIFKCFFFNENVWILIKISLKFVLKGQINNIPALVQIMAWHRPGDKPLSEPMMVSLPTHICVTRPEWVKLRFLKQENENYAALVGLPLTYKGRYQITNIIQTGFSNGFSLIKPMYFFLNLTEVCSRGSNWVKVMAWCQTGNKPLP